MCVYIYIYTCVHIYIYIYTYTYIHTYTLVCTNYTCQCILEVASKRRAKCTDRAQRRPRQVGGKLAPLARLCTVTLCAHVRSRESTREEKSGAQRRIFCSATAVRYFLVTNAPDGNLSPLSSICMSCDDVSYERAGGSGPNLGEPHSQAPEFRARLRVDPRVRRHACQQLVLFGFRRALVRLAS